MARRILISFLFYTHSYSINTVVQGGSHFPNVVTAGLLLAPNGVNDSNGLRTEPYIEAFSNKNAVYYQTTTTIYNLISRNVSAALTALFLF